MAVISSPLAKSLQGGLVQRVAGSTFSGGRGIGPISSQNLGGERSEELLENNQSTLSTISSNLNSIASEIRTLRSGIDSIATRLVSESKLEEAASKADAEYNRRLTERQIRTQGEQQLESKIQNALTAPVTAVATKVSSVFGNVGRAIQQLLFGWITIQIVDLIEAFSTGNTKKLQEIAGNILKTLAIVVAANGVLSLIKLGIGKVVGLTINLAARVGGFVVKGLFLKPFEILVNAIKNSWQRVVGAGRSGVPPRSPGGTPTTPGDPKGQKGGKGPGIFGMAWAAIESFMNLKNGEYVDAVMSALTVLGPGKFVKGLMASGYAADQIAEIFNSNIFGKDPNKEKQAREVAEEAKKESANKGAQKAQTAPPAQPQTPMMGDKKGDKGQESKEDAVEVKISGSGESGVSVAPGSAGAASSQSAVTPQTSMTPSAGDLSLGSTAATPNVIPAGATTTPATTAAPEQTPANITPAQTQSANTKMESLGPETKPQTTVIAQTPTPTRTQTPSMGSGASTDVPKIKSSNPENFYALYSQFNYNVVM
jgi:hypothetical protein